MPIDYQHLMALRTPPQKFSYADREAILYALSVGFGRSADDLPFVYERPELKTVPTLAVVIAPTGVVHKTGVDMTKVLHGEQALVLHRPLPPAAEIIAQSRVVEAYDKGEGKGAILLLETAARLASDETPLFTSTMTIVARADGGFGGSRATPSPPHPLPERSPDIVSTLHTRDDLALLYRLNGDRNPLHADPAFAARAGFDRPILHGLCSYGIACRAVIKDACDNAPDRIETFSVRFSAPAFPGDTIETEIWKDGDVVSFRCRAKERDVIIINNGRCGLQTA